GRGPGGGGAPPQPPARTGPSSGGRARATAPRARGRERAAPGGSRGGREALRAAADVRADRRVSVLAPAHVSAPVDAAGEGPRELDGAPLSRPETVEDRSLELPPDELRALIDAAARRGAEPGPPPPRQPSADPEGGAELPRSLTAPMPETGRPAEELLDLLFRKVVPKSFNTAGPGYLAYIPGGGLPQSAVADL